MHFMVWMTYFVFIQSMHCHVASLRNFALNKRAYQSSTENYNNFNWTADKAVDGNTDGRNPGTSRTCSKTDVRMGNHTWEADIGYLIIVKNITVYERSDGNDQLSGFQVLIGNHSLLLNTNKPLEEAPSGHFQHLFRASDSLARFITVIRQNKETLTLCEVVVHGECLDGMYSTFCDRTCGKCSNGQPCNKVTGECVHGCQPGWTGSLCDKGLRNFALKKRAYQSSTENYNNFDWTADKAVDGNTDGRNPDTSRTCSETDIRMGIHTWEVDIGFLIIVKSITVYERSDGTDQLSGFKVLVGNNSLGRNSKLLEKEPSGHFQHLFRAGDSLARFISVIRENKETLTLCEVVVYGECLDGMYSTFCDRTCGKCSNGQPCNKDTGECVHGCEPGWTGSLCDKGLRNFALNKRAYQSSTENYNNFDWTADKAVDGNTDGRNPDTSRTCSETDIRMGIHTWEVDIGFLIIVKSITVYERSDGNDQLSGFEVFIGNHSWPWNATKPLEKAPSGHFHHIFRPSDTLAKFITVVRQSKETLTLCEVVVHGECLDGMYSELCNRTCGKCFNGQLCNKDTGECPRGCEPDWTGLLCDRAHIVMTGNDSSENLTQTFSRVDVTVIVGSVIGLCVVVVIINIITVGVLKKRRSNDTRDSRMQMKETGAASVESREVTLIAENEYMELQDRGRM